MSGTHIQIPIPVPRQSLQNSKTTFNDMSEPTAIPPVPTPRKSKGRGKLITDLSTQEQSGHIHSSPLSDTTEAKEFSEKSDLDISGSARWPEEEIPSYSFYADNDESSEKWFCNVSDSGHENLDSSQIYEELNPGAPWQQELVAWLMTREFGSTSPIEPPSMSIAESDSPGPESGSLSFMSSKLAQRASLVLSRMNASSPTRLLVDVPDTTASSINRLSKLSQQGDDLTEIDRDFLSLFGVNAQADHREENVAGVSDSNEAGVDQLSSCTKQEDVPLEDHICEEFSVVSMRKGQQIKISVDRQDGCLCWITGTGEKKYRTLHNITENSGNSQRIHRRILAADLLRCNVDMKQRHVVHIVALPTNKYAKESPFSYTCSSAQVPVAMITAIAKANDVYNNAILSSTSLGSSSGVLCVGKIYFRQQSLQPWIQTFALITESRHFLIVQPRNMEDNLPPTVEHCIDLRYIRDLRQESAGDADGSRSLYMRFGTSTSSCIYVRPFCACSTASNCVCSATGCDPCALQFHAWQSILESLIHESSFTSNCLSEQLMSESDLPAIVDRILSHLTLSCLTAEGLHRQAGRVKVASDLYNSFRRDPWAVRFDALTKDGDVISAHDIVSTLKKFFQSLNRPLLLTGVNEEADKCLVSAWIGAHYNRFGVDARLDEYRKAFSMLHPVARRTLQAMLLHLRTVAALESQNRMNFLALAASWGPTLMCTQNSPLEMADNRRNESTLQLADVLPHGKSVVAGAIGVVIDLLSEMDSICPLDAMPESVRRDAHVQDIAVRLHLQPQQHKQAGEITLQVEVNLIAIEGKISPESDAGCQVNSRRRSSHAVHIAPRLTARDVIDRLCSVDEGIAGLSKILTVWEYLAGGTLRRPLLPETPLLDVCCSWAVLEPEDLRIDCKLVIEGMPISENEENTMYDLDKSAEAPHPDVVPPIKSSIPCTYSGYWNPDTFSAPCLKLKHWLYVNDSEMCVKSLKTAPSALMGASLSERHPSSARNGALARSNSSVSSSTVASTSMKTANGSFRSFFSNALSHIHGKGNSSSQGRIKLNLPFSRVKGIYGVFRSDSNQTSGVVIIGQPSEDTPNNQLLVIHLPDEMTRDRLLSFVYQTLHHNSGPKNVVEGIK